MAANAECPNDLESICAVETADDVTRRILKFNLDVLTALRSQRNAEMLKALKKIRLEATHKFSEQVHAIKCKYHKLVSSLYGKRGTIIGGEFEPNDEESQSAFDEEDKLCKELKDKAKLEEEKKKEDPPAKGNPEFSKTIFKNVSLLFETVQEHEEPILKYLRNLMNFMVSKAKLEEEKKKEDPPAKGNPEFLQTIFKNVSLLSEMFQEHEEPILKYIKDIMNSTKEPMVSKAKLEEEKKKEDPPAKGNPEFSQTIFKNVSLLSEMVQEHEEEPILKYIKDIMNSTKEPMGDEKLNTFNEEKTLVWLQKKITLKRKSTSGIQPDPKKMKTDEEKPNSSSSNRDFSVVDTQAGDEQDLFGSKSDVSECHGITCPSGTVACSKTVKTSSDKKILLTTVQCEDVQANVLNSATKSSENPFENTQISSFSFTGHYNYNGGNVVGVTPRATHHNSYYNNNNYHNSNGVNLDDDVETFRK